MGRPHIAYLAAGGTIASVTTAGGGAEPSLSAADLLAGVSSADLPVDVRPRQVSQVPSSHLTFDAVLTLFAAARTEVVGGAAGVVISLGTDTMEEVAFALDLLWDAPAPLVLTGAMRNPSLPGPDGPANLTAALRVASSPDAAGLGVLVVLNEEIHAARFVRKTHTSRPDAFSSAPLGPIGWLAEGHVRVALRPPHRDPLVLADSPPPVAVLTCALGDDLRLLASVAEADYSGLVLDTFGSGHVPPECLPLLEKLVARMPIVFTSRVGRGEVGRATYGYAGSEGDLLARGLIPGGSLDVFKARVLLSFALASGEPARVAGVFASYGSSGSAG